jgi:triosephosphate isomerase
LEAVYDLLNHSEDREAINQAAQILKAVAGSAIKGEV